MSKSKVEYLWLDGYKPTANLRGKTKIIDEMKKEDLSNKNIVIEGVVPYNKIGIKLLEKEIKLLTKITKL